MSTMKRIYFCILALAAVMMVACQKEHAVRQMTFYGTISGGTKTTIDTGGITDSITPIKWESSDKICVFADNSTTNRQFAVSTIVSNKRAKFTGTGDEADDHFLMVYPYNKGVSHVAGTDVLNNVSVPQYQSARAGSYHSSSAVMTGYATGSEIRFKNLCALIAVTPKFDCASITLTSEGSPLSGTLNATIDATGAATFVQSSNGSLLNQVVIEGTIQANKKYYIAVLPGTYRINFSFLVKNQTAGTNFLYLKKTSNQVTLHSSDVVDLGEFDQSDPGWTQKIGSDSTSYYGHYYVDLGLPSGLKWATYNVGATLPQHHGDYFAFGETFTHYTNTDMGPRTDYPTPTWRSDSVKSTTYALAGYSWSSYLYYDSVSGSGKDSRICRQLATTICGSNNNLLPDYDVAYQLWSGASATAAGDSAWRMPTLTEITELMNNTYRIWTTSYRGSGVMGYILCTKSATLGTHIFLPVTNLFTYKQWAKTDFGYYWTSTDKLNNKFACAHYMEYSKYKAPVVTYYYKMNGRCVRPVTKGGTVVAK